MTHVHTLVATMRALANEIRHVKAVPDAGFSHEHHLYLADLELALDDTITRYEERCDGNPSLTDWQRLLAQFERSRWPVTAESAATASV